MNIYPLTRLMGNIPLLISGILHLLSKKNTRRKLNRSMPTPPETSKQCAITLPTREVSDPACHGELLLAVASWRRAVMSHNLVYFNALFSLVLFRFDFILLKIYFLF
jgi:hypothetical protein